jgi:hypothetical protein
MPAGIATTNENVQENNDAPLQLAINRHAPRPVAVYICRYDVKVMFI